jgi:aromatic ring-opening dioxygenase LigB subunit
MYGKVVRNMAITGAVMVPHPPLLIPQVGRGGERQITKTSQAYHAAARWLILRKPETLVLITPHNVLYRDYLHISPGSGASGSLAHFGAPEVRFDIAYDTELAQQIVRLSMEQGLSAGFEGERDESLDHGTIVPLYFFKQVAGSHWPYRFLRLSQSGLTFRDHYLMGTFVREAAIRSGRRVGIIASGDLSHFLKQDGPYGYRQEGPIYDARIMDIMGRAAFDELLAMDLNLCEKAGECGQRSLLFLAGALDGQQVKASILSYEGGTGVGYGVGYFEPGDPDKGRAYLDKLKEGKGGQTKR